MKQIIDFIMHIDENLLVIMERFGAWSYVIIFLIVFAETGFVVTPFLPGDSLLFAVGTIAARGGFNIWIAFPILLAAAILGDSANYEIGHRIGRKAFRGKHLFKQEDLEKTEAFYEKHGPKTIILARFIPIVRTFAPFVAGIGKMHYGQFITYNIIGGLSWVTLFLLGGYFFGNIPIIQDNFELAIIAIIFVSILPGIYHFAKEKFEKKEN